MYRDYIFITPISFLFTKSGEDILECHLPPFNPPKPFTLSTPFLEPLVNPLNLKSEPIKRYATSFVVGSFLFLMTCEW